MPEAIDMNMRNRPQINTNLTPLIKRSTLAPKHADMTAASSVLNKLKGILDSGSSTKLGTMYAR